MLTGFALQGLDYEHHPAFAGLSFEDGPELGAMSAELVGRLEDLRARTRLPSTNIGHLIETEIAPRLIALRDAMVVRNAELPFFADFADRLVAEMLGLIREDLSVLGDRGLHVFLNHSAEADRITRALSIQGYQLGRFDEDVVARLGRIVAASQKRLRDRYEREGRLDRETLSTNEWSEPDHAALAEIFNEAALVAGLSNYMGSRYMFMGTALELSVPGTTWWAGRYGRNDESEPAAYYHVDMSSPFPKLICYLSDVSAETGPTSLLPGALDDPLLTQVAARALDKVREDPARGGSTDMASLVTGTEAGRRCFAALPKALRAIGHFGNDILAGSSQERHVLANQVTMTGPAGSFVLFDGARVPHRGGIVREGRRWALQCVYKRSPR